MKKFYLLFVYILSTSPLMNAMNGTEVSANFKQKYPVEAEKIERQMKKLSDDPHARLSHIRRKVNAISWSTLFFGLGRFSREKRVGSLLIFTLGGAMVYYKKTIASALDNSSDILPVLSNLKQRKCIVRDSIGTYADKTKTVITESMKKNNN